MWKPARGGRRVRLVRVILGAPGGDDEGLTVERPVQGLADLDLRHPARVDVDVVHGQGRGRPGAGLQAGIGPYLLDLRRGHGRGGDGVLVVTPVGDQPVGLLLAATAVEVHNDAVEVLVADRVRPRVPVRVLRQDQRAGLAVTVHHVRTGGHELGFVALVEEDHAVQFLSLQHGPASALSRVHLVVAVPRPFDGRLAQNTGEPAAFL